METAEVTAAVETATATAKGIEVASAAGSPLTETDAVSVTRIGFVDDHPMLLRGIAALFSENARYDIVGTEASAEGAVALARQARPDMIILDLSMPGDVFAAMRSIVECSPRTKLIVFTAYADVDLALRALDAGAHAFVLKGRPAEELFAAIESVRKGGVFVSPDFAPRLIASYRKQSQRGHPDPLMRLSPRERQLVQCLFEGMSNKEIARTLDLTEKTVKHYMTKLMNKLKVRSRLEVVLAARNLEGPSLGPGGASKGNG